MPTIQQSIANLTALKREVPTIAANEMVNFALDNIRTGKDINGNAFQPRKAGAPRNRGRAILVDTGDGRRSISARVDANGATLTANEYMQAHNTGVSKPVTVRSHTRRSRGRSHKVSSHSRTMNLPARTFAGDSPKQRERIQKVIAQRITQALT